MDEAVILFEEIVTCRYFLKTPMILFLNKHDLFLKKVKKVPIRNWKEEFPFTFEEQKWRELCEIL
eukprot:TRINITY_DN3282_c0_g1_i1.p3 TRINITY_DN3282_c0_g1~~TRINITY_DN3282_c0_g1_i1.p3  ORF type:complete len:65 (+),score=11.85 TRINITY_DN3282_c0_g1_i1:268-462(+)